MRKRTLALFLTVVVLFGGIGARLLYLAREERLAVSGSQSSRVQTIAISRGTIYDRYGEPLVNRERRLVASVSPTADCMETVRDVIVEDAATVIARLEKGERVTTAISAWMPPTLGIVQIAAPVRYDSEGLACHVVGYVNGEGEGVSGVEKCCDERLSAFSGEATVRYRTDALGNVSSDSEDTLQNDLARCSGGVALTLDAQIQAIVAREAAAYMERGAVVVSAPETGEILASVSLPTYDQAHVETVLEDAASPLLDRTLIGYNLGSVFKIVIAAAALENGMSVHTAYTCTGSYTVNGQTFHCHNPLGDGLQTMDEAMEHSCNTYFIQLALDIGAEAIREFAVAAGFEDSLSLIDEYGTSRAVLPREQDLSADAALANLAIGQGDLLGSSYHVAMLLGAVAADGEWHAPSLLYGEVEENGTIRPLSTSTPAKRLFSRETAKKLQEMLLPVVVSGTGTAAQPSHGTAAGKTGTAETGWEQDGEEVVQSWFAGYYPAQQPQYVITVLSENGGQNGKTAAPLFAAIADALYAAGLVKAVN